MTQKTGFLAGKKLLITGVLSNRSIAYGIARACHAQGAELAFSYQGERFKERISEFAADFGSTLIFDLAGPTICPSKSSLGDAGHHLAETAIHVSDFSRHARGKVRQ